MNFSNVTGMGELKIEAYESCPCGSEKKFKFCCYRKAKESQPKIQDYSIGRVNHLMAKSWQDTDFKICMAFDKENCDKTIKGAHSIQNNRILNRISEDGHVYCFKGEADENGVNTIFKKISKNKASTFFGFCDIHDTELFLPIEQKEYSQESIQNFLFAFRAHAIQFHKKQRELKSIQNISKEFPYLLFDPTIINWYRVTLLAISDCERDYSIFRNHNLTGNFNGLRTIYRQLDFEVDFAVCSSFAVQYDLNKKQINDIYFDKSEEKMPSIYINVYPIENGTNIILSYHLEDERKYKEYFDQLESLSHKDLLNHLSFLIIEYAENVFFSPTFVERLNDKQKESILKSFGSSILISDKFDLIMKGNYYNFDLFSRKSTV
ncbi:SEC-C domain-containing protein [Bacillus cereus]|nr:SEC-C domain-containing protein [Bacillus cereus]